VDAGETVLNGPLRGPFVLLALAAHVGRPSSSSRAKNRRGLRITVYEVLDYLASGMSEQEILADFPDLTADDIKACLAFAADRERRLVTVPAA
jgi:hypothetical protein